MIEIERLADIQARADAHNKTQCGSWPQNDESNLLMNAPDDIPYLLDLIAERDKEIERLQAMLSQLRKEALGDDAAAEEVKRRVNEWSKPNDW